MRKILIFLILLIGLASQAVDHKLSAIDPTADFTTIALANAHTYVAGDRLLLNKGETFYGTLIIGQSGTSGSPIIIGAYGTGANPIITGFTTITGWTNEGNGIYSKVITSDAQTNMVTVDGVNTAMGRTPNSGTYNTYESCSGHVSITDNGIGTSTNWTNAEVVIRKNLWRWDRGLVTNHTGDTFTYTDLTTGSNATANYGYFIQNDLRTLDQLGEWYHNTTTGTFYMYFGMVDPTTKTVKVATKNYGVYNYNGGNGADYIVYDNLNFTGYIKSGVYLGNVSIYNTVQNCSINLSGGTGVEARWSASYTIVTNCTIANTTNGAVCCMPDATYLTVTNCNISNTGLIIGSNLGTSGHYTAISASSDNDLIQYNSISNTGYDGIYIGGNSTEIRNNLIDNSCLILNDGGAIYTYGTHTSVVIDGNIVLNSFGYIGGTPNLVQLGDGIYLDEYANGITVSNNTVANCSNSGIKIHKGHDDIVSGNTLYNNQKGINFENWVNEANLANITFTGNKCIAKSAIQYPLVFTSSYASYTSSLSSFTMSANYYARPIDDNLSINTSVLGAYNNNKTLAQWKTFSGKDANSNKSSISISSETDLQFEYNATSTQKITGIAKPMVSLDGLTKYVTSVSIPAYSAMVLIVDPNPAVSSNPLNKKSVLKTGTKYYINPATGKFYVR